jgi:hypothetical protein
MRTIASVRSAEQASGDAASKYRMARVTAPCLLCMEFLHLVMLYYIQGCISEGSDGKDRDVAI